MIDLRFVAPEGTFIPGKYPKLQYRTLPMYTDPGGLGYPGDKWSDWADVPTVVDETLKPDMSI